MRSLSRVLRIADTQYGVATRRQLLAAGVSDDQIRHLLTVGALGRAYAGVYLAAGSTITIEQRALAACLACGDHGVASFATAGALIGICPAPETIDVSVPHTKRPRTDAFRVHRTSVLGPIDVVRRGPLVHTSPSRTLADLASCTPRAQLAAFTDEVLRRRLISAKGLTQYLDRPSIRVFPGTRLLRTIVADRLAHGLPDSNFEALMIDLVAEYGLPCPIRQHRTLATGRRVRFDLVYPEHGFIIELDGWDPHSGRQQWQSDHDRHNAIELAGWGRLGFTWEDVNHRRSYVAVTVGERLGLRPSKWIATGSARRKAAKASRLGRRVRD